MIRPVWEDIWLQVAAHVGERSLCSLAQVGAVIADRDNRIIATGYNGPPAGYNHRDQMCAYWCGRAAEHQPLDNRCLSVHAEANALLSSDRAQRLGGTIFVNKHPCWECSKLIANSGLDRLSVRLTSPTPEGHHTEQTYPFLESCGITVEVTDDRE